MQEKLYFYYTNDLHSNFDNWPQVAGFVKDQKSRMLVKGASCWLVDIGDHVDRVDPIAEAFLGKANVRLMNDAGFDFATLGNNEGITMAHEDLHELYNDAVFEVVCANLHSMTDSDPDWLQSVAYTQSFGGVRVGIVGLTAPFRTFYELLDWRVSDPLPTLKKQVHHLKKHTDIIILLSHLGLSEDQEIARRMDDIDVIIGGHTHHLLRTGEMINHTMLTAAGKHGAFAGEVILTWDHASQSLVGQEAYTTDISHLPKDMETMETLQSLSDEADRLLDEPVVHLEEPLEVKWFQRTLLMQRLTAVLQQWTRADAAMLNAGMLLDHFPAGAVTKKDIHRICPHSINPCTIQLQGDELLEVIRVSLTKDLTEMKLKGFGFRGEIIGKMIFAGLDVDTVVRKDGNEYVQSVRHHGKKLDPDKTYTIATADTFTFGRLLPEVAKSEVKHYFLPEMMRDLLSHTLKKYVSKP
ncbi:bifunctional UDP-sugar hydrolase/5'-nucleotidase [Lentibacillus halophilus]|uniref:Bifunctional UDP-sugar hydrolase/5'-nucleotidase n=1 Tax=Lentibacillus halophilus TaxID=295065 RepID=A0ABP3IVE0_9BACI